MIIPAYNEEKRIAKALDEYLGLIDIFGNNITITVMSESRDSTNSIVSDYSRKYKGIRLVKNRERLGKGGALLEALKASCAKCGSDDILGFVDADGSVGASEVKRLINALKTRKLDGIIGSRYLPGSRIVGRISLTRIASSRAYNVMVRLLFGLRYNDTQCSAKFFRAGALCRVLDRIVLYHTTFDVDVLYKLKLDRRNVVEVPIVYKVVKGGIRPAFLSIFFTTIGLRMSHTRAWRFIPGRVRHGLYRLTNKAR